MERDWCEFNRKIYFTVYNKTDIDESNFYINTKKLTGGKTINYKRCLKYNINQNRRLLLNYNKYKSVNNKE
jgi:hypothetical protein